MFGSKSTFFLKSDAELVVLRSTLDTYMITQGFSSKKRDIYLTAYDYFCICPMDFDGATIVKDLNHIPGLDINAMLHDYHYLIFNVASNFTYKWKADWLYAKEMEITGKGYLSWIRWFGLKITGPLFVFWAFFRRGKITRNQELEFQKQYEIIMQ